MSVKKARIAYFGSDAICLPGLRYLCGEAAHLCELALIVSQPDRRAGRGKHLQQNPVAAFAAEQGLPLLQPEKPDAGLVALLADAGLALAFVNFHGSILPAYRGASPVETAIAMGEAETGVCLMQVARGMDAGAVADCERVRIDKTDTAPDLRAKIGQAVVPLLRRNLASAVVGELPFKAQHGAAASYCRKITKEDAALDFQLTAQQIERRLRAFTPWPGAYFDYESTRIKVGRAAWLPVTAGASEGTVLAAGDTLDVATGRGVLQIHELQRPGGRMLPVEEFLRGFRITCGSVLPSIPARELLRSCAD